MVYLQESEKNKAILSTNPIKWCLAILWGLTLKGLNLQGPHESLKSHFLFVFNWVLSKQKNFPFSKCDYFCFNAMMQCNFIWKKKNFTQEWNNLLKVVKNIRTILIDVVFMSLWSTSNKFLIFYVIMLVRNFKWYQAGKNMLYLKHVLRRH